MPPFNAVRSTMGIPLVAQSLPVVKNFLPIAVQAPDQSFTISGVTKDSTGAAKASATVYLFEMRLNPNGDGTTIPVFVEKTVSNGSGQYSFTVSSALTYWITDYKSGAPDLAGATKQTLTGV